MTHDTDTSDLFECPCCGSKTLSEIEAYEVCDICNWEDDPVQRNDPDYEGGANDLSLNQARMAWLKRK
jgi:hypothetical protein